MISAFSSVAISLIELLLFTSKYRAFFDAADYRQSMIFFSAASVFYGTQASLHLLVWLLLTATLVWLCARLDRWLALGVLLLMMAATAGGPISYNTFEIFSGEIEKLQFEVYTVGVGVAIGYLFFALLLSNLRLLTRLEPPRELTDSVFQLVLAYCLVPVTPLVHLGHRLFGLRGVALRCLAGAGLIGTVLLFVQVLYPDLRDYSNHAENMYAIILIFVVFLFNVQLLSLLRGRLAPGIRLQLGLVLVAVSVSAWAIREGIQTPEVRMVANQYARINNIHTRVVYNLLPENELGFSDPGGSFVFYGPKHATLPVLARHEQNPRKRPLIFVWLADAARADRQSAYGYARDTTPHLARFAQDATIFRNHYSAGTATTVGLRHLFSGSYSSRFMLEMSQVRPFFVKELLDLGYRDFYLNVTGSDYNGISIEAFDRHLAPADRGKARYHKLEAYREQKKVTEALETLGRLVEGGKPLAPFLMYLHSYSTHMPWRNHDDSPRWGETQGHQYDNSMHHTDRAFGRFIKGLKQLGLYRDAIILVTADHGTGLEDHGFYGGFQAYEEQIRIPLLIKMPGCRPGSVTQQTSSIDIAPTLINSIIGGVKNRFHGISLMPLIDGSDPVIDRDTIVSLVAFEDAYSLIYQQRWKLHYHRARNYWQLYDLKADPAERRSLTRQHPEMVKKLTDQLARFLWRGRGWYGNPYHYKYYRPWIKAGLIPDPEE